MEPQTGVLVLAIVSTLLAIIAGAGQLLLPTASKLAVKSGETKSLWKIACFTAPLFFWSVIVLVLQWVLVYVLNSNILESDVGAFFGSAILLGVPLGIALARGQGFWDGYWQCIDDSLKKSTVEMTREQRTTFNEQHEFLLTGSNEDRKGIRAKILKLQGPERRYFGGTEPGTPVTTKPDEPERIGDDEGSESSAEELSPKDNPESEQ